MHPLSLVLATCTAVSACGGGGGNTDNLEKSMAAVGVNGQASAVADGSPASADSTASAASDAASSTAISKTTAANSKADSSAGASQTSTTAAKPANTASASTSSSSNSLLAGTAQANASKGVATGGGSTSSGQVSATVSGSPIANSTQSVSGPAPTSGTVSANNMAATAASSTPQPIRLAGTGVPGMSADACTETANQDFVEAPDVWTAKRLVPKDCAILRTPTPVFAWSQPANRDTSKPWTFVLLDSKGGAIETRSLGVPRLLLSSRSLPAGRYAWNVSYVDRGGKTRTSDTRRFEVAAGSEKNTLPTPFAVVAAATAKAHPRLLPTGTGFGTIVTLATNGELKDSYAAFVKRAETALAQTTIYNPDAKFKGTAASGLAGAQNGMLIVHAAEDERNAIEALAYVGKLKNDSRYTNAAVTRLLAMAAWDSNGVTSETNQDQANREVFLALAQGLDFLDGKLTTAQSATVTDALKIRLQQATSRFSALDTAPYNSHVLTAVAYATEALLYTAGNPSFPEAKTLLAQVYETWMTHIGIWGGADGGFGNGTAYGWYTLSSLPRQLAILKLCTGLNLANWQPIAKMGDQFMAMTPPTDGLRGAFGDDAEVLNNYTSNSFDGYRMLAGLTRDSAQEWYWRQSATNVQTKYALPPAHYMLLALDSSRPTPVKPSRNSFVFEDAGLVAMHSATADPLRSSLYFRSSSLGSFNHSHADNNAFTYVSKGKDLLISAGYYPYYESPHHALVGRATRFKNALTFDGGIGQAEPSKAPTAPGKPVFATEARGRITNYFDDGVWAATSGDASLAYRGRDPSALTWTPLLTNAIRSVAMNRSERVVLIYDWATSATPRKWELNFQSLAAPTLNATTINVSNGSAKACIDVYGPSGNISTASGFPIAPENGAPNHFRAIFKAGSASTQLASLTVIREDCRSVPVSVNVSGAVIKASINGGPAVSFDQKTVTMYAP
ncbi:DUF4962 domain-containing protein [Roseateles oligotrophus]|uniref:DUF4962 domain-containing protein n=1 Tax=Roseateles oligotrophus TaxID=1769250 RepID=UPI001C8811A6|nr:DUF4962 domain-containing protein [Roseateles oligotrophus]